ncbi:hypothetical protein [uncultured Bilophila sp.]|uniref:hypothetical protein n=1 Tax=uncultured Bilophila sp. TaxID=529385 RepID=UPI0026707E5E|nr:hypothetical protein [uncultured Bilophila sp.]
MGQYLPWIKPHADSGKDISNEKAVSWKTADAFFVEAQRNGQQHALAMDSAKGKAGEKGRIFTVLWG